MDFFQDIGKYATLGSFVAILIPVVLFLLKWLQENMAARMLRHSDAERLAITLAITLDDLVTACVDLVEDPMLLDHQGLPASTVKDPDITLPEGEYTVFPSPLMFDIVSLPKYRQDIGARLACIGNDCGPLDYAEYYRVRKGYFAGLGLQALDLIKQLNEHYQLPAIPMRDEHRTRACLAAAIQASPQGEPGNLPVWQGLHPQLAG